MEEFIYVAAKVVVALFTGLSSMVEERERERCEKGNAKLEDILPQEGELLLTRSLLTRGPP